MIPLKNTEKGRKKDLGALYGRALDKHNELERDLARIMHRWDKSRALLKRLEKRLDEAAMDEAQAKAFDEAQAFIDDPI